MNKLTKLKIELAKVMAKFSEYATDKGLVYSEGDWVSTSTPLYVFDENGTMLPAPDADYESPERTSTYKYKEIWTVVNGVVTAVQSISTSEQTTEEIPATETTTTETESTPAEETPATETEPVVAEQSEQTPIAEETTVTEQVVTEEDVKFNKVFEMMNTLVSEMSTIKSDIDALNTTMTNAKLGQQSVVIKDNTVNKSKDVHPIWSVK